VATPAEAGTTNDVAVLKPFFRLIDGLRAGKYHGRKSGSICGSLRSAGQRNPLEKRQPLDEGLEAMRLDPTRVLYVRSRGISLLRLTILSLILALGGSSGLAAEDKAAPADKKAADEKAEGDEIPKPEDIDLSTEDGLEMKATYYPGTKAEESIPVILVHGLKGSRKDFTQEQGLAAFLQERFGCAVIVPDLRGHGDSTRLKKGTRTETLKAEKLQPAQHMAMVTQDLRAVKNFLWKKNNAKELNIDKLMVIGTEAGATVALNFAAYDAVGYEHGQARYGQLKLGKFVRAAVLISPVSNVTGLKTAQIMKMPEIVHDLPVMLTAGKQSKDYFADADRFCKQFKNARPPAEDDKPENITVWFYNKIDTKLQGAKLLNEPSLAVNEKIGKFFSARMVTNPAAKEWGWKERRLPHE
jgi:pimeloyl-ACP methyl ester carboxylesterase